MYLPRYTIYGERCSGTNYLQDVIEKNFDENHPVKKWWRKHVVAEAPKDIDI